MTDPFRTPYDQSLETLFDAPALARTFPPLPGETADETPIADEPPVTAEPPMTQAEGDAYIVCHPEWLNPPPVPGGSSDAGPAGRFLYAAGWALVIGLLLLALSLAAVQIHGIVEFAKGHP